MRSLRPSLIMEHHSVPSISDLAREASLSSTLLRRGRQTYATDSVGGFSLRSRSLMRLRGRVSAKLIRNLSDPDRLSCSLTLNRRSFPRVEHPSQPPEVDQPDGQEQEREPQPQTAAVPGGSGAAEPLNH